MRVECNGFSVPLYCLLNVMVSLFPCILCVEREVDGFCVLLVLCVECEVDGFSAPV